MSNELVVIENVELVPFFTRGDQVDVILEAIAKEARSHVPDVSTRKGREAIKAMVTKVTKSKTYLESKGKDLAAEYKEIPKKIDENRKKTRDFLTELQAEIRKPLTEWEEEQERLEAERIAAEAAEKLRAQIESDHEIALLMNEKFDRELAERLAEEERQRAEAERIAEEQRKEREEQIRREAQEAAERKAKQDAERIEREKAEAIARAEQAERDRVAAEERAKVEAELAEKRRIEAEAKAKRDAAEAAERARLAEIQRQADEAKRVEDEAKAREANKQHKAKVNNEMLAAFVAAGLAEDQAKLAVTALAKGEIPHVGKIIY